MGGYGWRPQYYLDAKGKSYGRYVSKKSKKNTEDLTQHEENLEAGLKFFEQVGETFHIYAAAHNRKTFENEGAPSISKVPKDVLPFSSVYVTDNYSNSCHRDNDSTKYVMGL